MKISELVSYFFKRKRLFYILTIYFSLFSSTLVFASFKNQQEINLLVDGCFLDLSYCKEALVRIHSYQEEAAIDKNFPCQTSLLGLEANLLMAMNNNLKKKKTYNIVKAVKKYC